MIVSAAWRLVPTNRIRPLADGHAVEELDRAKQAADRFFQVDNMNQVALAVDVRLHLGVPPAGAVAVVNPCINKIFDNERHAEPSGSFAENPAAIPRAKRAGRPC